MKMTKKQLEDKVAELEKRIAAIEQRPVYVPVYQPIEPQYPLPNWVPGSP